MVPQFSSAWLELAMLGLATALVENRRLSSIEGAALCPPALAAAGAGRAAILRATCAASDSGWAHVVRGALREAASDVVREQDRGGYRDAPSRTTSGSVSRLVAVERARLRRHRAIGLAGAAAGILGSAMLLPAQSVAMSVLLLAAAATGWRVLANARRATAAVDEAGSALPDLLARLPPPPAALAIAPSPSPVLVRGPIGLLGGLFAVGMGLCSVILGAGLTSEMRHVVPASQIGLLLGIHVMLLPLLLVLGVLLPKVNATLDAARGEVVVVHRLLGLAYTRTIVPLEIVGCFFVEPAAGRRRAFDELAVDTEPADPKRRRRRPPPEQRILLAEGERVAEAAAALNHALGRTGWEGKS